MTSQEEYDWEDFYRDISTKNETLGRNHLSVEEAEELIKKVPDNSPIFSGGFGRAGLLEHLLRMKVVGVSQ